MSDGLSELLKLAGRRPVPDEHHTARARAAAQGEWKRLVRGRRLGSALQMSAIAATVTITVVASVWFSTRQAVTPDASSAQALGKPDIEVATIQMVKGAITVTDRSGEATRTTGGGRRLRTGDRVETTADSRAMFVLTGGTIVKVDRNTLVSLDRGVLALVRGALYLDVDPKANDRDFVVQTPLAAVRHLGTIFEVRLDGSAVVVNVREGEVATDARGREWKARTGQAMRLRADRDPEHFSITTYGREWNWVAELPRPFTLEGSTLRAFLDWVSRELGQPWEYEDQSMRARFDSIVQWGPIDGLTAAEALDIVLQANGLSVQKTEGRLVIVRGR